MTAVISTFHALGARILRDIRGAEGTRHARAVLGRISLAKNRF